MRLARPRRVRQLLVEGLTISNTASQELGPVRHDRQRVRPLGQKRPKRRVVPTEVVTRAVTVLPDAGAQPGHLGQELLATQVLEVIVHVRPLLLVRSIALAAIASSMPAAARRPSPGSWPGRSRKGFRGLRGPSSSPRRLGHDRRGVDLTRRPHSPEAIAPCIQARHADACSPAKWTTQQARAHGKPLTLPPGVHRIEPVAVLRARLRPWTDPLRADRPPTLPANPPRADHARPRPRSP